MKLKTIEIEGVTYAAVQDGKPVFTDDAGKDVAFDAPGTIATITRLNGEAKSHREGKETAERALKAFEGIADPAAALKALETVGSLDQKKLIDAGEVEKVKAEIAKGYEEKLTASEKRAADLESALYGEKIGGSFARSKFIAEKVAIPADFLQAKFGSNFKIEDGKIVAVWRGREQTSTARPIRARPRALTRRSRYWSMPTPRGTRSSRATFAPAAAPRTTAAGAASAR